MPTIALPKPWIQLEYLRGEITSGDEANVNLTKNGITLSRHSGSLPRIGQTTHTAIEYVDRSKARNLTELIATRDAYPGGEIPAISPPTLARTPPSYF